MVNEGGGVAPYQATLKTDAGDTVTIEFSPLRVKHANEVLAWERARLMRIARDTVADDPQSEASGVMLRAALDTANQLSFNAAGLAAVQHSDGIMRMFWVSARGTAQHDPRAKEYLADWDEFVGLVNGSDPEVAIEIGEAVLGSCRFLAWDAAQARQAIARTRDSGNRVPDDVPPGGPASA